MNQEVHLVGVAVTEGALLARGDPLLDENAIVSVTAHCSPEPLTFRACVSMSWPEASGGCTSVLQPLGLSAATAARWSFVTRSE